MARRTARDGDWIVWGTCGQVLRILTFRRRCWRFTRNKWCGREFRTFGNTSQSRWKSVLQWRGGRKIGRGWCRGRGEISGGAGSLKKKKKKINWCRSVLMKIQTVCVRVQIQ